MSDAMEVRTQATEYTVSALPESLDEVGGSAWAVTVAYRGRGRWAVTRFRQCLGHDGEWSHESIPSERRDEWMDRHRFDLDEALRRAAEVAPTIRVNGMVPADVLRKEADRA